MFTISTSADVPKRRVSFNPRRVRRIGIILFVLSFLMPPNFDDLFYFGGGFGLFVETPEWAFISIVSAIQESDWHLWLMGVLMVIGWASNFSIF